PQEPQQEEHRQTRKTSPQEGRDHRAHGAPADEAPAGSREEPLPEYRSARGQRLEQARGTLIGLGVVITVVTTPRPMRVPLACSRRCPRADRYSGSGSSREPAGASSAGAP